MKWRLIVGCLALALCLCACGGLGGEPEIMATLAPLPTSVPAAAVNWQPDIKNGARIFAEHCTECHGISGDGQGELVAAGSVPQPIDMTDPAVTAEKSPLQWYELITEGRIENLMPPWGNALSESERWDVALYAYTLAYNDALLEAGEALWRDQCGDCKLPPLIPPVYSDNEYGAGLNAEAFNAVLSETELGAAVAYARMQSLQNIAQSAAQAEVASESILRRGTFSGRVAHGSADGTVPAESGVRLQFGNAQIGYSLAETTIDTKGHFVFNDIPLTMEFSYLVGATYQDRVFSRRLLAGHPADTEYEQTIMVYDLIHDPSVISVASIELFINPVQLDDWGAGLVVTQIVGYRNDSDRLYTSGRGFDDGREASLLLQVPDGARIMSGDENGRFVFVEGLERVPDSLIDTQPVTPGDGHQIVVDYFLPYDGHLDFVQALNNMLDAEVRVTLPKSLSVQSAELDGSSEASVAETLRVYSGLLKMEREPRLSFVITGDPFATSSDDEAVITSDNLAPLLAGMGAAAVAGLAGLAVWRRQRPDGASEIDALVKRIANLDEEHDRGQINHDVYRHRRRDLKRELAALMGETIEAS